MTARLRKFVYALKEAFWLVPGAMVLGGILLAVAFVQLDRSGMIPDALLKSAWLYNGGGTGARTLLGAIASSTIGVAGTVFSITIASLSLAAGQMGPRLLRNFTHDRGNQFTLGAFLGTFSYALMVLRTVRTHDEGVFVPHASLSFGIFLAFICVATLVYFVDHIAGRINVDTVIDLVSDDIRSSLQRLTTDVSPPAVPEQDWHGAKLVTDDRRGYLQQLDQEGLADWAAEHGAMVQLLVRPGDFVFPGAPIGLLKPDVDGIEDAVRAATALGMQRVNSSDLEFAVRQLVEVAVRALSPGINDPNTAISVLERLGTALCEMTGRSFPASNVQREGRTVLTFRQFDYDGLTDVMFHMIRQNAAGSAAVLIRIIEILTVVATCEKDPDRIKALSRHAALVLADAERTVPTPDDLRDVRQRYTFFTNVRTSGLIGALAMKG